MSVVFLNDYNVSINKTIKTIEHSFTELFIKQDDYDILFRRIIKYLIKEKFINGNIIDAGAWIGSNSIQWAMNQNNVVYAIDPCLCNIDYITKLAKENDINNIQTQHNVLSDKHETLSTNDEKNNYCFMKNTTGKIKMTAVTLDHLYTKNYFDNVAFIHLTVNGFEYNAIQGATNIIQKFKPIIAFKQHLEKDNYKGLCSFLYEKGYNVYLINEVLFDSRIDCRNLIAIPNDYKINIYDLHHWIGNNNVLLSVMKWNNVTNVTNRTAYTATIFGDSIKNNNIGNIKSIHFNGHHIFSITDNNYTKMIVIDNNENWICAKHILGEIDINCEETVINAYLSARTNVKQQNYNIKHIKKII